MKKYLFIMASVLLSVAATAQVKVAEPEFTNSYEVLTSDSTFDVLPKESGTVAKHENKTKGLLGKISKVASAASSVGVLGAHAGLAGNNLGGAVTGLKVASTASSISGVADAGSALYGIAGMDIVFTGKSSSYSYGAGKDMMVVVRQEKNEEDPMGLFRIVRFTSSKKDRRIQWMQYDTAVLGTKEAEKSGYINFTGHKYGEHSYLLTIPSSELEKGEYGIFYVNIASAMAIPVATFGVK